MRKPRSLLALAALAAPMLAVTLTAGPASATGNHLKEASGSYYVGADSLSWGTPTKEVGSGSARALGWSPNGGTFTWNGTTYNTGYIQSASQGNTCVHVTDADHVSTYFNTCSGIYGNVWGLGSSNGHTVFVNRAATQYHNQLMVLSGFNTAGRNFKAGCWGCASLYQRFDWQ